MENDVKVKPKNDMENNDSKW